MSEEQEEGKLKISDKRRFDESGDKRAETDSVSDEAQGVMVDEPVAETQEPLGGGVPPEINFGSFIVSLATQAMIQLGDMKAPEGVEVPVDPLAARQTIDIIEMLKNKTKGNLEEQEESLIEEILHNLRMSFLSKQ